jgi:type I restriction enzyme S subunit
MMEVMTTKTTFQKYSAYKDSGVEWLGEIPEGWEYTRMKRLYLDFSKKNYPDAELLSVTQNQGVVPRTWVENRMVMPSGALDSFKFINKGDFAISLRSFEGGLEYCYHDGIISPAYTVLKKRRNDLVEDFYKYLFKSYSFISELQTSVVGIREGKNISYPELSYSYLPVPSPSEQTAIANFLDDKTAKIDQAIAQKEQLIALLKERKQIIIQNAVTKGLDPNVKLKDSGVEWIGEIPEHWEVIPIRRIVDVRDGTHDTPEYIDESKESFHLITSKDFNGDEIDFSNAKSISKKDFLEISKRSAVQSGDVIMSMIGGNIGKSVIANDFTDYAIKNVGLFKTQGNIELSKFIRYYLLSGLLDIQIEINSRGGAQGFLSLGDLRNLKFFKISSTELVEIIQYIETQSAKINQAISLQQAQIEKLKEYKATLIDSAVTGKIKVS